MTVRRRAFTLIELLVVIGIIAVLIGILIPVVNKVRQASQTAATRNQVQRISSAISNYFHEFNAYPGALGNDVFVKGTQTSKFQTTSPGDLNRYTQSEDLVMALMGGMQFSSGQLVFFPSEMGLGPLNYNQNAVTSGRKAAFIEQIPAELPTILPPPAAGQQPKVLEINEMGELGQTFVQDSTAPEFLDRYAIPRPILYMRANPGALADKAHILRDSTVDAPVKTFDPTFHYDFATIKPYLDLSGPTKDFYGLYDPVPIVPASVVTQVKANSYVQAYFTAPSGNTALNAGTYLLISAGQDRIFGTQDDIIVGGGGGQ